MNSVALYKALIEVGALEESAARAAEDANQVPQVSQLVTKVDMAKQETRLMRWIAGIIMFLLAGVIVASIGLLLQIMLPLTWMVSVLFFIVGGVIIAWA